MKRFKILEVKGRESLIRLIKFGQKIRRFLTGGDNFKKRPFHLRNVQRILLIRHDRIGDMIMLLPTIAALREGIPKAKITILASPSNKNLVEGHPHIDEVLIFDQKKDVKHPGRMFRLVRELRRRNFDLAVVPSHSFTSGLLAYLSSIPFRLGSRCEHSDIFFNLVMNQDHGYKYEAEFNLDLIRSIGINCEKILFNLAVSENDVKRAEEFLRVNGIEENDLLIGLHPGAGQKGNKWPLEKYAQLANELLRRYRAQVIITWGPGEENLISRMVQMMEQKPLVSYPTTNLKQLAALLSTFNLFIGNSTGPMHLAVAMGTPVLALFGSDNSIVWGPPLTDGKHRLIKSSDGRVDSIEVREVLAKVEEIIGDSSQLSEVRPEWKRKGSEVKEGNKGEQREGLE